ncbi:MAG: polysaccharide biosynthesis protein [Crocinitomicaceae bacterium]|nr:polysaccharide biosynthesis protein [Crocinitomicaceae bacterium]
MSSTLKRLAGQTAIYGLSSILGRFLNYLLTPLHTGKEVFTVAQYGIITEMYSYVAFLVILLTYGMETAYFRYANKNKEKEVNVFTTVVRSVFTTSLLFISLAIVFRQSLADVMKYPNHSEYIVWFAIIVGMDALSSIPMARLRSLNMPLKFASVNLANVGVNIGLNLFFLAYCMPLYKSGNINWIVDTFYDPDIGVGYVFIANLVASLVKIALLLPWLVKLPGKFDNRLWQGMIVYALPLLIAGLAGIINETLDRILIKYLLFNQLGEEATMTQLGIYGACYKVSIIITLFIQAYRYAAEPFFFSQEKEKGSKNTYALIMNYFVIVCSTIFLGVMLFIDLIKHFIPNDQFWVGLKIVPVLLMANVCLGIYYNQSIWYKLSDKTKYGAFIAIGGALITICLNIILIPIYGYVGSAWVTLIVYASMVVSSYILGQKHYPIPYNVPKVLGYLTLSLLLYLGGVELQTTFPALHWVIAAFITLGFALALVFIEKKSKNNLLPQ